MKGDVMYNNILVALDLKDDNKKLLERSVFISNKFDARLHVIHVGEDMMDVYSGIVIDHLGSIQSQIINNNVNKMKRFLFDNGLDISRIEKVVEVTGELNAEIDKLLHEEKIELLICGHRFDFFSKLMPTSKHFINNSNVDVLVVPLSDNE